MRKAAALFFAVVMLIALPGLAFDDVPSGNTFEADIEWLADSGITRGCNPPSNTRFCPDQAVTRGAMAAFLTRALDLPAATQGFDDTTGHVFANDIAALAQAGITRGCNPPSNTRFCPDQAVTRAQMAAFLNRALGGGTGPGPGGLTGTIYGHWSGNRAYRFDLDAANPQWEQFLGAPSAISDVVAATNEWVGTTEGAWINENVIGFYDLDTQLENESLILPESGDTERRIKIQKMAVSDDGQLIAAQVTEWLDDPHVEVVRRSDALVLGSGFDQNETSLPATALEWTPGNDLVVAGSGSATGGSEAVPVIGVIAAAAISSATPYEQSGEIYFALTDPGAGAIQWVALSSDGSQVLFVERGNVWVAPFQPGATPRQLTTGFWAGDAIGTGWTGQFSPDGQYIALANQVHQQFVIPNHTGPPINLLLDENEDRYEVGGTLVNHIDAWLP